MEIRASRASGYAQDYAARVALAFDQAIEKAGEPTLFTFSIGELLIRLEFAGEALPEVITPALQHLQVESERHPDLTVRLWDSASTGVTLRPPSPDGNDYVARGEIKSICEGSIHGTYDIGGGQLGLLDRETDVAHFWIREARQVPYYESGSPLRGILSIWLSSRGHQLVHAASVCTGGKGALIVGRGGSGKSTTALSCVHAGLDYIGDDYCVARLGASPELLSLYSSAKLSPQTLGRFSRDLPRTQRLPGSSDRKQVLFLHGAPSVCIQKRASMQAILLPRVTHQEESTLKPVSPIAALTALAPSTVFQLPGAGEEAFRFMADLVRHAPAYQLNLSSNPGQTAGLIQNLLEGPQ